ncbi:hypothetical protein EVAR_18232_1 [Eumeta japonica]|uniref:Uncharacterized protein n=1 Tax=Eumeta variegata TaxID=151549 RepID=A0A4C1UJK0_EUMVA|nr:hypothetical protein EVAR_18232_1 [Eumeta japonica]
MFKKGSSSNPRLYWTYWTGIKIGKEISITADDGSPSDHLRGHWRAVLRCPPPLPSTPPLIRKVGNLLVTSLGLQVSMDDGELLLSADPQVVQRSHTNLRHEPRQGRPGTVATEENIDALRWQILESSAVNRAVPPVPGHRAGSRIASARSEKRPRAPRSTLQLGFIGARGGDRHRGRPVTCAGLGERRTRQGQTRP